MAGTASLEARETSKEPARISPPIPPEDSFAARHIGPSQAQISEMAEFLGVPSIESLSKNAVPSSIAIRKPPDLPPAQSEFKALEELRAMSEANQVFKSYIGLGYYETIVPAVIQKNVLENPSWYTPYTPYQAEIAQGRLEALLNFQTMVADLTALPAANASLLDEATAAAEALLMMRGASESDSRLFFVSENCFPQTIAVVSTRAEALGLEVLVGPEPSFDFSKKPFGVLLQYPRTDGRIEDYRSLCSRARESQALVAVLADLMSLALIRPPGEFGADIAVGSTQRFGIPMGCGGPHAAYMAAKDSLKRHMPGRIVGVSKDASGKTAYRLSLQTREQHIRREKATSNICTAQALLAAAAGFYAVYHGPEGLRRIAERIHGLAALLAENLKALGLSLESGAFFDTIGVRMPRAQAERVKKEAEKHRMNFRFEPGRVLIALGETADEKGVAEILEVFSKGRGRFSPAPASGQSASLIPAELARTTSYLTHPVFNSYRSEAEMTRYLKRLENKDISLTRSMIPLGSCTMKLNAASEMAAVFWPGFSAVHPYAPETQKAGYRRIVKDLGDRLRALTGFSAFSFQPNAGSQGEYAGLLAIKKYHEKKGERQRNVCLIPASAHGTNPASAAMAGLGVVVVATAQDGSVDLDDLKAKAEELKGSLAAFMITYPSTHGVFEPRVREMAEIVHRNGGLVYLDGANMNALMGLARPADFGADVCHLNLHKTFAIPHGGGGPGMGPIGVTKDLAPYLPTDPLSTEKTGSVGPVAAAPWGSASILPVSWSYVAQLGAEGLLQATRVALLNANYLAKRLEPHYPILFKGPGGWIAHECIIDLRPFKAAADVTADDVAKRLMDYGFHAPTVSFPVAGTMMIEPTESESKAELDRFCEALIEIRKEIREIEEGRAGRADNLLKNAPHTLEQVASDSWNRPYGRSRAAFPLPWIRDNKFWPPVARIDNAWGDRNFFCACPPVETGDGSRPS